MSIDFGALPPEVNSALLYAGPGSTSLTTAASAWNALAAELNSAALGYGNVVTQLSSEEWLGPASASMASAATPYVEWMTTTSLAAEHAAAQAQSAAAAFEAAFASVVPPPLIAANRAELAQAVQANVFGQYNSLISQLEAQYSEFWAQDSATMYSYASQASTASQVTPFTTAPAVANPAAAATQAASTAATNTIQGQLQLFLQQITNQLQILSGSFLASKGATINSALNQVWFLLSGQTVLPNNFGTLLAGYANYASFFYNTEGLPYFSVGMGNFGVQIAKSAGALGGAGPAAAAIPKAVPALGGVLGGGAAHTAGSLGGVSGSVGSAGSVGKLSVPVAWSGATVPATHATAVPVSTVSAAPEAAGNPGNLLGGMPLAGAGTGGHGTGPRYGFRPTIMARPPAAG
jgi:PPE-repeat protein